MRCRTYSPAYSARAKALKPRRGRQREGAPPRFFIRRGWRRTPALNRARRQRPPRTPCLVSILCAKPATPQRAGGPSRTSPHEAASLASGRPFPLDFVRMCVAQRAQASPPPTLMCILPSGPCSWACRTALLLPAGTPIFSTCRGPRRPSYGPRAPAKTNVGSQIRAGRSRVVDEFHDCDGHGCASISNSVTSTSCAISRRRDEAAGSAPASRSRPGPSRLARCCPAQGPLERTDASAPSYQLLACILRDIAARNKTLPRRLRVFSTAPRAFEGSSTARAAPDLELLLPLPRLDHRGDQSSRAALSTSPHRVHRAGRATPRCDCGRSRSREHRCGPPARAGDSSSRRGTRSSPSPIAALLRQQCSVWLRASWAATAVAAGAAVSGVSSTAGVAAGEGSLLDIATGQHPQTLASRALCLIEFFLTPAPPGARCQHGAPVLCSDPVKAPACLAELSKPRWLNALVGRYLSG